MNPRTIAWLLEGEPWIEYRARVDLLEQPETDPQVGAARRAMVADPKITALVTELKDLPGTVLNSHKSASQSFHKLEFLADPGLMVTDRPVKKIVDKVKELAQVPELRKGITAKIGMVGGGRRVRYYGEGQLVLHVDDRTAGGSDTGSFCRRARAGPQEARRLPRPVRAAPG